MEHHTPSMSGGADPSGAIGGDYESHLIQNPLYHKGEPFPLPGFTF